jgi:hypothetical protein
MSVVDALLKNAAEDTDLLRKNDARGDDFAKPRVVDFIFVSHDSDRAAVVRDFINDNQYGDASLESGGDHFRVLVRVMMPTTQHVLCSVSALMTCIAQLFDVEYDGWGCELQTP